MSWVKQPRYESFCKAGVFSLVHCADTDKQAQEEAKRAFMSYVATTLQSTPSVREAGKLGRSLGEVRADPNRKIKEYEGGDPRKVDLQYLIDTGMCVVGSPFLSLPREREKREEGSLS